MFLSKSRAYKLIDPLCASRCFVGVKKLAPFISHLTDLGAISGEVLMFFSRCKDFLTELILQVKRILDDCHEFSFLSCMSPMIT